MRGMDADSIDAIVCDPPYGLSFMARDWDHSVPGPEYWREVLRVAKPGAHLVAFGGTRTYHRLTCAIEDAGWEIRDCLQWLYGSGFPKSHNIGNGRGTALKPAWEPIVLARKPFPGTVADNVIKYGTGALNIDGCRIGDLEKRSRHGGGTSDIFPERGNDAEYIGGRWPANLVLDEEAARMLDAQSGEIVANQSNYEGPPSPNINVGGGQINRTYQDTGGASRFFYTSKASREEREGGLDGRDPIDATDGRRVPPDNA
jgi:site-specific DNA-methyltransferase (adenine-specific)